MAHDKPDQFDFDAWLEGASQKRTRCRVTLKAGIPAAVEDIDQQIGEKSRLPETEELRRELCDLAAERQRLVDELESSYVTWRFRDLVPSDTDAVDAEMGDRDDREERSLRLIARQVIEPDGIDYDRLRLMAESDKVPVATFRVIVETALAARDATSVDVPFSLLASHYLSGGASSSS